MEILIKYNTKTKMFEMTLDGVAIPDIKHVNFSKNTEGEEWHMRTEAYSKDKDKGTFKTECLYAARQELFEKIK